MQLIGMPCLELTVCLACRHVWNAFFPLGKAAWLDLIQCPSCGSYAGAPK